MKRRAALVALTALTACRRESARPDGPTAMPGATDDEGDEPLLPQRPPYPEPPYAAALATGAITTLRDAGDRAPFLLCEIAGVRCLLLVGTRESPHRWRPQVAMARLARRLGLESVPATTWRRERLGSMLDVADEAARTLLRTSATLPDGRVQLSATALPASTTRRGTAYSHEAVAWARLAESPDSPTGAAARTERAYVSMLALDYLAGNLFRRTADEADDGRLLLVDNRSAFGEHPEARAVDALFARLKRGRRFPEGLAEALARLDERTCDDDFRAGDYESWLVQKRPIRELLLRARALRGLIEATHQ